MLVGEPSLTHPTLEMVVFIIVVCANMEVAVVFPIEAIHAMGTRIHFLSFNIVMGLEVCLSTVLPCECLWAPGASIWSVSRVSPHVGY